VDFNDLRAERSAIAEMTRLHAASLHWFKVPGRPWFRKAADVISADDGLRSKSSSATCFESLIADAPLATAGAYQDLIKEVASFAEAALALEEKDWESEGAARVYVRVRTLPVILERAAVDILRPRASVIARHMDYVWARVRLAPGWQGVSEAPDPGADRDVTTNETLSLEDHPEAEAEAPVGYPPHAFHTYWGYQMPRCCS
jgi:hypothetical protein